MQQTGIKADIFLRKVLQNTSEIELPAMFIVRDESGPQPHSFYHKNSVNKKNYIIQQMDDKLLVKKIPGQKRIQGGEDVQSGGGEEGEYVSEERGGVSEEGGDVSEGVQDVSEGVQDVSEGVQDVSEGRRDVREGGGDISEEGGDVSEGGGDVSEGGGDVSDGEGDDSEGGGDVSEEGGDVSEGGGDVSEGGGDVSERGDVSEGRGDVSEEGGDVSEGEGDVSEGGGDVSDEEGDVSERGGDVSEIGGDGSKRGGVSEEGGDVSERVGEGDVSEGEGNVSEEGGDVSEGGGDYSEGEGDVSEGGGDVSEEGGDVSEGGGDYSEGEGDVIQGGGDDDRDDESDKENDDGIDNDYYTPGELKVLNIYRYPLALDSNGIKALTGMEKHNFIKFCTERQHVAVNVDLSVEAQCLLFLIRYRKNISINDLTVNFVIKKPEVILIIETFLFNEYLTSPSIPFLFSSQNVQDDVKRTMLYLQSETPPLLQGIISEFVDPTGRGRQCVVGLIDATYLLIQKPGDLELQKITWYTPKAHNVIKLLDITTCTGKYAAIIPLAASISPKCGDTNLASSFIKASDSVQSDGLLSSLRQLLEGTDDMFLHIISDAGFEHLAPNLNNDDVILLRDVCEQHGAMFTSTKVVFLFYLKTKILMIFCTFFCTQYNY